MLTNECPMPVTFRESLGITVFIAWLFYLNFIGRAIFGPMMPLIENDLGISHSRAGAFFLTIAAGQFIGQVFSGLLSSRVNHRGTLLTSVALLGLSLVPFAFLESIVKVQILLFLIGLAGGLHMPSAIATITGEVRPLDWGKALGVHQTSPPLSFTTAPLITAVFVMWFSWRNILASVGCVALLTAVMYALRGRGGRFPGRLPNPVNVKIVLSKPSFWIMVALFAMAMGATAGLFSMLPLFLVHEQGMELGRANTLIGLSQLSGLFMAFFGGMIADRFGQKPTIGALLFLAGVCTLLIGYLKGPWLIVVIFLQPALTSAFFPAAFAAASRIAPPNLRSVTNSLAPSTAFLIGGGLIPALIGYTGEIKTFALGISLLGYFIIGGPLLTVFLNLGQYDKEEGC